MPHSGVGAAETVQMTRKRRAMDGVKCMGVVLKSGSRSKVCEISSE
jgi:hypothetical protein